MREPLAAYRLPSGRHGLPPQAVEENQRLRLMAATVELLGERGLRGLSSAAIVRRASVSASTFYRHFENVDDCLRVTSEMAADAVYEAGAEACGLEREGAPRIRAGLDAILELLAAEPGLVGLLGAEVPAASPAVRAARQRLLGRLAGAIGADPLLPAAATLLIADRMTSPGAGPGADPDLPSQLTAVIAAL